MVKFADPARVNILGHIFASILTRGLATPAVAAKVAGIGRIGIEAGGMSVTADFGPDAVTLSPGRDNVRAWVAADMFDLVQLCMTSAFLGPWLAGKIRFGGNPFPLLKLLAVLKAARG